jgi:hypothetical protein
MVDSVRTYLDARPEVADGGRLGLQRIEEFGAIDRYHWNLRNWGTKWNSCGTSITTEEPLEFLIDTVWGPPLPVMVKASTQFPALTFTCYFIGKGTNFAGYRLYQGGETSSQSDSDASDGMYSKVYGSERLPCDGNGNGNDEDPS